MNEGSRTETCSKSLYFGQAGLCTGMYIGEEYYLQDTMEELIYKATTKAVYGLDSGFRNCCIRNIGPLTVIMNEVIQKQ